MYLLDTNVISETRKPRPHGAVLAWIHSIPSEQLMLSAVTLGELQRGVERVRKQDFEKAAEIEAWLATLGDIFEIVPATGDIFRQWAVLMKGRAANSWEDPLIAATAKTNGLVLATRNIKDFEGFDVACLNPFNFSLP